MRNLGLILALCIVLMHPACAPKHGAVESVPPESKAAGAASLTDLNYLDEGDMTRVVIESNREYHYTSYSTRPDLFVLELSEVDTCALPEEIGIGSGGVESVKIVRAPEEEGDDISRLHFHLSAPQNVDIFRQENFLYLDFSADTSDAETSSEAMIADVTEEVFQPSVEVDFDAEPEVEFGTVEVTEVPADTASVALADSGILIGGSTTQDESETDPVAAAEPHAETTPVPETKSTEWLQEPATEVAGIDTYTDERGLTVAVEGDGALSCTSFELPEPSRLVLDFPETVNRVRRSMMELQSPHVFRIRVAQFQIEPIPITRVVLDCNAGSTPYSIEEVGSSVLIRFGDQIEDRSNETVAVAQPVVEPATESFTTQQIHTEAAKSLDEDPEPVVAMQPDAPQIAETLPVEDPVTPSSVDESEWSADEDRTAWDVASAEPEGSEIEEAMNRWPAEAAPTTPPQMLDEPEFPEDDEIDEPDVDDLDGETTGETEESKFASKTIFSRETEYTGEEIEFEFTDVELQAVFFLLADISGKNIVLDPGVRGKTSIKLKEVPWDQALDIILKNHNLGKVHENNVIRIAPLSRLAQEEKERRKLNEEKLLSVPLVTRTRALSYAKAAEVSPILLKSMSQRGEVTVDERTNTLIMKMIPDAVDPVERLIDLLDRPTPQVMIEARIVETTKTFAREFGIQWGFQAVANATTGTTTNVNFPNNYLINGAAVNDLEQPGISGPLGGYAVNLPPTNFNSGIGLSLGNILDTFRLDLALTAMENEGKGRILSTPKVVTQNNEIATIESGTQIPVQTTSNNTTTTQFVTAALKLEVTPQITADQTIIMDVIVDKSSPDFGNMVGGIPPILTRKAETTVLVKDGGTAVIGGIFQLSESTNVNRVPFLSRIPVIKHLFKNKAVNQTNDELLLFLTPRIIDSSS